MTTTLARTAPTRFPVIKRPPVPTHPAGPSHTPRGPARVPSVRPAPRREPPFDDEIQASASSAAGPLDRRLPFGDQRPGPSDQRRLPARSNDDPMLPAHLPEPAGWGRRLLIGIIETASGRRPLAQLAALLSPVVAAGLRTDLERAARRGTPHWTRHASVRKVYASTPARGVAEVSATLQVGGRVRAVALRLEERNSRWRCTRLHLG